MQRIVVLLLVVLVSACASRDPDFYKHSPSVAKLEVPPDLTKPSFEDTFNVPQIGQMLAEKVTLSDGATVELKRDGRLRWLEVSGKTEQVWNLMRDFWDHNGIALDWENTQLGLMETDWVEYPGSEFARDRYRVRIEAAGKDRVQVYMAHRGIQYTFHDGDMNQTWGERISDPELEIEVLGLLLDYLRLEPKRKQAMLEKARRARPDSKLQLDAEPPSLLISTGFGRAWQLTALSVDRLGYIIESRNKDAGKMVVRLEGSDSSVAGSLFNKRDKVTLRFKELGNDSTQLWLEDMEGRADITEEARNMLIRIKDNLR